MQRSYHITELTGQAKTHFLERTYAAAIQQYAAEFTNQKSVAAGVYLSFFLACSGKHHKAHAVLRKVFALISTSDATVFEAWGDFFKQYHCDGLACTAYTAAIDAIEHPTFSFSQMFASSPPRKASLALLKKAAHAALLCGKPTLSENFLSRSGMVDFSLGLAKLSRGEYKAARPYFKNDAGFEKNLLRLLCQYKPNSEAYLKKLIAFSETVKDHPEAYARVNYFLALFNPDRTLQIQSLLVITRDSKARWKERLLSGIALYETDGDYIAEFTQLFALIQSENDLSNVSFEDHCILTIATNIACRDNLKSLLHRSKYNIHSIPPFAIPVYLRSLYLQVWLTSSAWERPLLSGENTHEIALIVDQLQILINQGNHATPFALDDKTAVNLAVQALCPQTAIGRLVACLPTSQRKFLDFLNLEYIIIYLTDKNNILNYSTISALTEAFRNLDFLNEEKQVYPNVYARLSNLANERFKFLGQLPTPDFSKYEALFKRKANQEIDWVETLENLKRLSPTIVDLRLHAVKALCFAKTGNYLDAKNEIKKLNSLALPHTFLHKLICEELADFFHHWRCDSLAFYAYTFVPHALSDRQLLNAGTCASKLGRYDEAIALLKRITSPTIRDLHIQAENREQWIKREKRYHTNPNPLNKFNPEIANDTHVQTKEDFHAEREFQLVMVDYHRGSPIKELEKRLLVIKQKMIDLHSSFGRNQISNNILSQIYSTLAVITFSPANPEAQKQAYDYLRLAYEMNQHPSIHFLRIKFLIALKKIDAAKVELMSLKKEHSASNDSLYYLLSLIALVKANKNEVHLLQEFLHTIDFPHNLTTTANCAFAVAYGLIGEKNKVREILKKPNVSPHVLGLYQLSNHLREDYVYILLRSRFWPEVDLKHADPDDLGQVKKQCLAYVKETVNLDLGLQILCTKTFIGKVFNIARGWFDPSLLHGSKHELLSTLEEICRANKLKVLLPDTHIALLNQITEDSGFMAEIKHYPNLHGRILQSIEYECSTNFSFQNHKKDANKITTVPTKESAEADVDKIYTL